MPESGVSPPHGPRRWSLAARALLLCVVVPGLHAQVHEFRSGPDLAFPGASWETATPESQGLDGAVLAAELAALPWPANQGPLMVVANGRVVHTIGDVTAPEDLFSCSKAVTGMVVGRLLEEGRIPSLDVPVPNTVPGAWNAYPGDATFRMFLTMTSDYGLPAPRSPGARHAYNNHAVDFCGEHLSRTYYGIGPDRMHDVVQRSLLDHVGREDPVSFNGQWGGWYGGLRMSCRDLARLGLLLLRDGEWQGQRLLAREYTTALFRHQIPASSTRYRSSNPNESSMWNQQSATNRLDSGWSFGLWRAGDERLGRSWEAAAMEGYRGKRVLLCPRGTLPDPELEVMLVCLPRLRDEGPDTDVYRDAILCAVIPPERHPEHDPRCLTATFDDATTGPLDLRSGSVSTPGGVLRIATPSRLLLPDARSDDQTVVIKIRGGVPRGGLIGALVRAATPQRDAFAVTGSQTFVGLEHTPHGTLEVAVLHPRAGSMHWHNGPPLVRSQPSADLVLRIDVEGDRVLAEVNGETALTPAGYSGIPVLPGGGFLSLRSMSHTAPIDVDYALARPSDGPIGQVTIDRNGDHMLTILAPDHLGNLPPGTFAVEYDDVVLDPAILQTVVPYFWSTVVAAEPDHLVLSSRNAPVTLPPDRALVFQIGHRREGEILR